jgi:hypothetical protein
MCAFVPVIEYTQSSGAPTNFLPVTPGFDSCTTVELALQIGDLSTMEIFVILPASNHIEVHEGHLTPFKFLPQVLVRAPIIHLKLAKKKIWLLFTRVLLDGAGLFIS